MMLRVVCAGTRPAIRLATASHRPRISRRILLFLSEINGARSLFGPSIYISCLVG